jgi:hypothetical protein
VAIVVLGAIFKQNNGPTPFGTKKMIKRRKRKYLAGDYSAPEVGSAGNSQRQLGGDEEGTS